MSVDTTITCSAWQGCRDLDSFESAEVFEVALLLMGSPNGECILTGQRILDFLDANAVKIGNQPRTDAVGSFNLVLPFYTPQHIVISPTLASGIWESRATLIHEGYHARGNVSVASDPTLRQQQNTSIYEPEANAHESACINGWASGAGSTSMSYHWHVGWAATCARFTQEHLNMRKMTLALLLAPASLAAQAVSKDTVAARDTAAIRAAAGPDSLVSRHVAIRVDTAWATVGSGSSGTIYRLERRNGVWKVIRVEGLEARAQRRP
jgi:hypothetical protein